MKKPAQNPEYSMYNEKTCIEKAVFLAIRVGVILLLLLCLWATFSCGSKKKLIQKTQFSTEMISVEKMNEVTDQEVKTEMSTIKVSEKKNVSVHENFQGEVSDSQKEATVTVENLEGKKVYRYINFKNVRTSVNNSNTITKDSLGQNLSKINVSKTQSTHTAKIKEKASGSERVSNVNHAAAIPWWVWIILGIYSAVSIWRNSLNPFKWFG